LETSPYGAQSPAFRGPLRARRLETGGIGGNLAAFCARSPMPISRSPELSAGARKATPICYLCARFASRRQRDLRTKAAEPPTRCGKRSSSRLLCLARLPERKPGSDDASCFSCLAQDNGRLRA
jgi:hypothetical protein